MLTDAKLRSQVDALWDKFWTGGLADLLSLQEQFAGVVARVEGLRARMSEAGRQVDGLFESMLSQSFQT